MSLFTLLLIVALVIQLIYYLVVFTNLLKHKNKSETTTPIPKTPVSVIICAKNEAKNLAQYLPFVLQQNYPSYEVVVVNDNSADETSIILKELSNKYDLLKVVNTVESEHLLKGKKQALATGIIHAQYNVVLLTDADCKPNSNWISLMMMAKENKSITLGYAPFFAEKGLLSLIIRYENVLTAIQYLSFASVGQPYMGVGRNLLYEKSHFDTQLLKGQIASGDDDLLINAIANKSNTNICIQVESFVYSKHPQTVLKWFKQKMRHYSTGGYYKPIHLLLLGIFVVSKATIYPILVLNMLRFNELLMSLGLYCAYLVALYVSGAKLFNKLKQNSLIPYIALLDFGYIVMLLIQQLVSLLPINREWKRT